MRTRHIMTSPIVRARLRQSARETAAIGSARGFAVTPPADHDTAILSQGAPLAAAIAGPQDTVRALLSDGGVVNLRQVRPSDQPQLLQLHQSLPDEDRYLRFFTLSPSALLRFVRALASAESAGVALGAFHTGRLVGVASYQTLTDSPQQADVAFAVARQDQARGIGTLLLTHLVSLARGHGIRRLVADVLVENSRMMRVFHGSGLSVSTSNDGWVLRVGLDLTTNEHHQDMVRRTR